MAVNIQDDINTNPEIAHPETTAIIIKIDAIAIVTIIMPIILFMLIPF